MKTLILMRHAKSTFASPGLGDRDRPLSRRGEAEAPVMARWLADRNHVPNVVLYSPALRARQTAELMRAAVPNMPEPVVAQGLYHAPPEAILEAVRHSPPEADIVLVVAHEPGISAAAMRLSDGTGPVERSAGLSSFPTAAMAVFEVPARVWADLGWGTARTVAFVVPWDLMEQGPGSE